MTRRSPPRPHHHAARRVHQHRPLPHHHVPVAGAPVFIEGPGNFAYTDVSGAYRIEGVPVQGVTDPLYEVSAIDTVRKLQGRTTLPRLLAPGGSLCFATDFLDYGAEVAALLGVCPGLEVTRLGRTEA